MPPVLDLQTLSTRVDLVRVQGNGRAARYGLPVAGGHDCDGDGHADLARGGMLTGDERQGQVELVFLDGSLSGEVDTASPSAPVLRIAGGQPEEHLGSEIWIDDITGDGLGDLIIGRQNASHGGRIGTGALTLIAGGPSLRARASDPTPMPVDSPPIDIAVTTLWGAEADGRLGIWMRTGDLTGDGIADLVVGADQEGAGAHRGTLYVLRGGPHLVGAGEIDLAELEASPLARHLLTVVPPEPSLEEHFGATCVLADLDGNGRAELIAASTVHRIGASLVPEDGVRTAYHWTAGRPHGRITIAWDDNFDTASWPAAAVVDLGRPPGTVTRLQGGEYNWYFGEELLGGGDYDGDGQADLVVGDIVGDWSGQRNGAGSLHVFYRASELKGLDTAFDQLPEHIRSTTFLGAYEHNIAGDTATHGDYDGDGLIDLAFSAPEASPDGRAGAGRLYVAWGKAGGWPTWVDLNHSRLHGPDEMPLLEVWGAQGTEGEDYGDMIAYSAGTGDLNGDGLPDLFVNEMLGNGADAAAIDVGNVIGIAGSLLSEAAGR